MARPGGLIRLWEESWAARGWEPVILNKEHAMRHEGFAVFDEAVRKFPTVNRSEYELACYHRHLAMAEVTYELGQGLLTDYDVINYEFEPEDCKIATVRCESLFLEPTRVPCSLWAKQQGWEDICDALCNYEPKPTDLHNVRSHVSDMTILRQTQFPASKICIEAGCSGKPIPNDPGHGWKKSPLVHYASSFFGANKWDHFRKHEKIRWLRPLSLQALQPA